MNKIFAISFLRYLFWGNDKLASTLVQHHTHHER